MLTLLILNFLGWSVTATFLDRQFSFTNFPQIVKKCTGKFKIFPFFDPFLKIRFTLRDIT